jgi:hypothetical protein
MQPIPDEGFLAFEGLRLRYLVLVMRELQVGCSAMDVETHPEILRRHHRALDVPPGTSRPPWRRPRGLTLFRGFPQREVERVLFARVRLDPLARTHLV